MAATAKKFERTQGFKTLVAFIKLSQAYKMELFVKIVNGIKPLTIFTKILI